MTTDRYLRDASRAYATRGFRVLPLDYPIQADSRRQPARGRRGNIRDTAVVIGPTAVYKTAADRPARPT
jgi:predicted alpha/beta hydrolase